MRPLPRPTLALILGATALCSASAGLAQEPDSSSFSAQERRRLARGELVVRQEMRQRGQLRLIGGTAWQVVDASPSQVWAAVQDTANYTEFLPQAVTSRTVSRGDGQRLIYVEHRQGPVSAGYHIRLQFMPAQRMARFRVDTTRPGAIRDGWGFFIVQPFGRGKSMVTFGIMADVGSGVISGLVRPRVHEWMLRVPEELKKHVEQARRS